MSSRIPRRSLRRPVALAVHLACIGLPPALLLSTPVHAQATAADAVRSYAIPAGPLAPALTRFVAETGIYLTGTAELAQGRTTPGLQGSHSARAGLATLLKGTGLEAVEQGADTFVLRVVAAEQAVLLQAVKVNANQLGATTEGTGSYTTGVSRTSTGLNLSLRETPQSVTVMTRDRMNDQALDDISTVLDQAVGVTFNGTSAVGTDGINFYARGFEIKNFQIDGSPRPPAIYGFSETTTDLAIYDRVEIVRGATGLMSGAGSPSATINLVRKRPTAQAAASVTARAGSHDHYRVEADVGGPITASGNVRGRFVAAYQDSRSHLDRQSLEKAVFYGILEADLTASTLLTVGLEYQDFTNKGASRGGVPVFFSDGSESNLSRSTNTGAKWNEFSHQTTRLFASLEHRFDSGWSLKLEGEESRPDYDETFGYLWASNIDRATGANASMGLARWAGDLEQRIVNLEVSGPFALFGRQHELMAGVSHSSAEDGGDEHPGWWNSSGYWVPIPNAWTFLAGGDWPKPYFGDMGIQYGGRVTQDGAYAAVRLKPADTVSVILGARVSDWKETQWNRSGGIKTSGKLTEESGVVTPYAGVVVDLSEHFSAYASYTDIFEAQSAEDVSGNRLDPLEGSSYEVGMKGEFNDGRLNTSLSLFRIEQDNFAVAIPGAPLNPNGKSPSRAESGTVSKGVELEVAGELLPGWQIGSGYARAKPEDRDGERLLTEIPKDTVKIFTSYRLPGQWSALTVGGNLRWQGRIYTEASGPNGEDYEQSSLTLLDLMVKYALTQNLSLTLNANNVFDKTYYSGLSWANGVYGEPRSAMLSVRYSM